MKIGLKNYFIILNLWSPERIDYKKNEFNKFLNICDRINKKINGIKWFERKRRIKKDCTINELSNIISSLDNCDMNLLEISECEHIQMERLKTIIEYSELQ